MMRRAITGSIAIHAVLAGGLLWAASVRVMTESAPSPMMVDLVAESAGTMTAQPAHTAVTAVRAKPRPATAMPSIEPLAAVEPIDDGADADVVAVHTDRGSDAPAEAASPAVADDAWAEFYAAVRAAIERAKRYPPSARLMGQEDRVVVGFRIALDGRADGLRVVEPSRFPILNQAAIETVERVSNFPHPPADAASTGVRVQVPMVFALHNEGVIIERQ